MMSPEINSSRAESGSASREGGFLVPPCRLRAHVEYLAGKVGPRHVRRMGALDAARDYIEAEWRAQSYSINRQSYDAAGQQCANLEIERPGSARKREILLIGAHYDTVPGSPGANDNGSGVAALLEISRLFRDVEPSMTVRFVAFVNEEPPFSFTPLQGSYVTAHMARQRGDDIKLMVALETIGFYSDAPGSQQYPPLFRLLYPSKGNFIGFVSDFRSRSTMRRLARTFRAHSDFPLEHAATFRAIPGVSWSDHWSFWEHGYRAVMVSDTAFYRYAYYHTSEDTPEKLAYLQFACATDGLFRCFAAFAGADAGMSS